MVIVLGDQIELHDLVCMFYIVIVGEVRQKLCHCRRPR
jgi:hypothetical protein